MKVQELNVTGLEMRYGDRVIQQGIDFTVKRGDIFVIMGGSGCGKSTLLRHLIGLIEPFAGTVRYGDTDFWGLEEAERQLFLRQFGVLYQKGALWSSLTLEENVALPLREYTKYTPAEIRELVALKLALVGLGGFEKFYPSEISGGMQKRAGLARALALDPHFLFFDEPSAGLDPVSSKRLDDLILEIRDSLGSTIIMVTHELASIFAVATNSIFLDAETKTSIGRGNPHELLKHPPHERVLEFLTRGGSEAV